MSEEEEEEEEEERKGKRTILTNINELKKVSEMHFLIFK